MPGSRLNSTIDSPVVRGLALIFFMAGLVWALIGWIPIVGGVMGLVGALVQVIGFGSETARISPTDLAGLLGCAAFMAWGYIIWGGWMGIATERKASTARFWLLAAEQHLIPPALGLIASNRSSAPPDDVFRNYGLVVGLICLAIGLTVLARGSTPGRSQLAAKDCPRPPDRRNVRKPGSKPLGITRIPGGRSLASW